MSTQAAQLIAAIRRTRGRGMTYLELEMLRVSTSPWKRISEAGHRFLRAGERITRRTGRDGLVRIVVARG
jgi:hypothetical protein